MKKLLMVLLAVLLLSACSEKGPVVEGFVGRNVEDVYAWCSEIDPKYSCEVSYSENDEYEKDIVYEQSINAGKRLEDKIQGDRSSIHHRRCHLIGYRSLEGSCRHGECQVCL